MNVSISLPDHLGAALQQRAAALGKDVGTFLTEVVTEQLADSDVEKQFPARPLGFAERQAAWVKKFPVLDHVIDDSRESFYVGRES